MKICDIIWLISFRFVVAKEGWKACGVELDIYILFLVCECRARGCWLQEVLMVTQAVTCAPTVLAVPRVCVACQNLQIGGPNLIEAVFLYAVFRFRIFEACLVRHPGSTSYEQYVQSGCWWRSRESEIVGRLSGWGRRGLLSVVCMSRFSEAHVSRYPGPAGCM